MNTSQTPTGGTVPARRPLEEGYIAMPGGGDGQPLLIASYSEEANKYFFPRRLRCPVTEGAVVDRTLSPVGTLYAWTYVHFASMGRVAYANSSGYGVAQVDFPEGPRVQAVLVGNREDWVIGRKMRIILHPVMTDDDGAELCGFAFEPVAEAGDAQ